MSNLFSRSSVPQESHRKYFSPPRSQDVPPLVLCSHNDTFGNSAQDFAKQPPHAIQNDASLLDTYEKYQVMILPTVDCGGELPEVIAAIR